MYRYIKRVSDNSVFTLTEELEKQFPAFIEITEAERDEILDAQARKKERLLKVMPPPPEPAPSKLAQTPTGKLDFPPLPKGEIEPEKTLTVLQPHNMEMATGIGFGTPALTPVPVEEEEPKGETYVTVFEEEEEEEEEEPMRRKPGRPRKG